MAVVLEAEVGSGLSCRARLFGDGSDLKTSYRPSTFKGVPLRPPDVFLAAVFCANSDG